MVKAAVSPVLLLVLTPVFWRQPPARRRRRAAHRGAAGGDRPARRDIPGLARGGRRSCSPTRSGPPSWRSTRTTSATPSSSASGRCASRKRRRGRRRASATRWEANARSWRAPMFHDLADAPLARPPAQRPAGRAGRVHLLRLLLCPLEVWFYPAERPHYREPFAARPLPQVGGRPVPPLGPRTRGSTPCSTTRGGPQGRGGRRHRRRQRSPAHVRRRRASEAGTRSARSPPG